MNKEGNICFLYFILADWAIAQFNPYYRQQYRNHPISAGLRLLSSASGYLAGRRNYNSAVKEAMSPITRSQKRLQSSRSTPTRTARRTDVGPYVTPQSRGRSMSRSTSSTRSQSLTRWMGSNSRSRPRIVVSSGPASGGKFRTKRIGKAKSKSLKYRRKAAVAGVIHMQESSGVASDPQCVYVGHAVSQWQIRQAAWWAVFRQIQLLAGGNVGEFALGRIITGLGVTAGDTYVLTYRATSSAAVSTISYTIVAGDTVELVINKFAQEPLIDTPTVEFMQFVFTPVATSSLKRSQLKLDLLSVNILWKSALKMQNRTVAVSTDISTDEPDTCPVYGKSYYGPGLGVQLKANQSQSLSGFAANATTGLIRANAGSNPDLQEPLEFGQFNKVTQIGKVHLNSGEIKTSVLSKTISARFGYLMNVLAPNPPAAGATVVGVKLNGRFSVYRMFSIEKMMDANLSTALTNVQIAYENDSKVFVSVQQRYINPTVQFKVQPYRDIN